jgi:hypothetical protein
MRREKYFFTSDVVGSELDFAHAAGTQSLAEGIIAKKAVCAGSGGLLAISLAVSWALRG